MHGRCHPRAYVVAVDRATLPTGPFAIQLSAEDPPSGAPEERIRVDADLSIPGAVAAADDIGNDPAPAEPETLRSGDTIEPGYPVTFRMDVRCGIEWLGVLNDVSWRTAVPAGSIKHVPVAWREEVADGVFEVEVTIRTGSPPTATAVANGHKVVYQPAAAPPPACKQR